MHLFIVFPNDSGSTLMEKLLATSPHVSCLEGEKQGQEIAAEWMPKPGHSKLWTKDWHDFLDSKNYDWKMIKSSWYRAWDSSKPILLERSETNVLKTSEISGAMWPAKFVIGVRDPYSFCHSMLSFQCNIKESILHWINCTSAQIKNMISLGENAILITYEDMCLGPKSTAESLIKFLPELESLDYESIDLNYQDEGGLLEPDQRLEVRKALLKNKYMTSYFGYLL